MPDTIRNTQTSLVGVIDSPTFAQWLWNTYVAGAAVVDRDGRFLSVNKALCRILGYTEGELLSLTWMDVTAPSDAMADAAEIDKIFSDKSDSYTMHKRYITKMSGAVPATLTVHGYRHDGERVVYLVSQVLPMPRTGADAPRPLTEDEQTLAVIHWAQRNWKVIVCAVALLVGSDMLNNVLAIAAKLGMIAAPVSAPANP